MGGFTTIAIKKNVDVEIENIKLDLLKVPKKLRYYTDRDIKFEYVAFTMGLGAFSEHQFPKDKINSLEDFRKYWSSEALGEVFCPKENTLTLDTYFGRTSDYAMKKLLKYVCDNVDNIDFVSGSFGTMVEKVATKKQEQLLLDKGIIRLRK